MDKDLISYFDQRFDDSERRTRQIVEETARQIVEETTHQIEVLRQETSERFERVETEIRHNRVLIENLRSDEIRAVAEGVVNLNEKLDRYIERAGGQREEERAADRATFSHHQRRLDDHEERLSRLEPTGA